MKEICIYAGGYPEWEKSYDGVTINVEKNYISLESYSQTPKNIRILSDDIVSTYLISKGSRSVGQAATGAIIGGALTGGIGLLLGGALGASKSDESELHITYKYNGRELILILVTREKTYKIYNAINCLFASHDSTNPIDSDTNDKKKKISPGCLIIIAIGIFIFILVQIIRE